MKTVALIIPESFGQSYFEKHHNYPNRVRHIEDLINESELKFEKRLNKARLNDKSKEFVFRLKEVVREMTEKGCSFESVNTVRNAAKILKKIAK